MHTKNINPLVLQIDLPSVCGKTNIFRTFTDNLPTVFRKIVFFGNKSKIVFPRFSVDFQIFRKVSENSPSISQKSIDREFYLKHFPKFLNFPKFSENFETILVNVHFQFYLAAESIVQNGAILPDDQPIKLREIRTG